MIEPDYTATSQNCQAIDYGGGEQYKLCKKPRKNELWILKLVAESRPRHSAPIWIRRIKGLAAIANPLILQLPGPDSKPATNQLTATAMLRTEEPFPQEKEHRVGEICRDLFGGIFGHEATELVN